MLQKKQGYAGVSAMPLKMIESRKEFDWDANKPVEFRPYIKDIAGRKRLLFLGTVSAKNKEGQFDGSATPDLALIDSEYRDVVWIDVKHPSTWDKEVYDQLGEAWRSSEGIGYFFEEEIIDEDLIIQQAVDSIMAIPKVDEKQKEIEALQRKIDSLKSVDEN